MVLKVFLNEKRIYASQNTLRGAFITQKNKKRNIIYVANDVLVPWSLKKSADFIFIGQQILF